MKPGEAQKSIAEFGTAAFDAINKLQQAIRERDAVIKELEKQNYALRIQLEQERESIEF